MIARRLLSRTLVSLCAVVGVVLSVWSAPAVAQREHAFSKSFGGEGSGNGQLSRPGALAVNEETGDVYVIDRGNGRVEIFSSAGAYVGQFNGSTAPTGAFSWPEGQLPEGVIAVDNSKNPLDPSKGDVYVLDAGHNVIDKFTSTGAYIGQVTGTSPQSPFPEEVWGVAVDGSGALWVLVGFKGEVDSQFNDALANEFVSYTYPRFPLISGLISGTQGPIGLALDAEGNLYIGRRPEFFEKRIVPAKFTRAGELLADEFDDEETTGLAVDLSSNDLYVDQETSVAAFDPSGSPIERFGSAQMHASEGIAVDSATGTVYTADATSQEIDVFTAFVVPDATTGSASNFGETSVTVGGVADPDGLPVTSCVFEYGTSTSYGQSAPCSSNPGSGSGPVAVSAQLTGLERLSGYHFRLKVSNANGSDVGQDRTFVTPEPVGISEESVSDVSSTSVLFSALVNPDGADTTYQFEYGTSVSYGESVPVPAGDLGPGKSSVLTTARAQDLKPETTYHVRIAASNVLGTVYGPDETFTTQAGGGAFTLPDGREWEMVSPPSKYGASIEPMRSGMVAAAEDGSAISYRASGPVVANPPGNPSPYSATQVLSRRGAEGWSSEDIATPHNAVNEGGNHEYVFFSPDLSRALVEPLGGTPLAPEATEETSYVRNDTNGTYVPLVTASNVPPGTKFGSSGGLGGEVEVIVGTPDLSHVLLVSEKARLTSNTPSTGGGDNIYEWSGGQLQLVNVLPNGTATAGAELGDHFADIRHVMSDDGSRVFWSVAFSEGSGSLYMRNTVTDQTMQVDSPAPGVSKPPASRARFQLATADGSTVFFLDEEPLTLDSTLRPLVEEGERGPSDLYMCQVVEEAGESKCDLTDLSVDHNTGEQANVQSAVLGTSEDGSIVYFVATGKLAEGAETGKDNLYVESKTGSTWSTRFVAVLSEEDHQDWGGEENGGTDPGKMTSRVSPNGRYLAFMSDRSLTGYDNRDASSGQPDEEVFLYDEATSQLRCASCNPTGARPDGVFERESEELLVDRAGLWEGRWLAASIPGWMQLGDTGKNYGATYQSRYLSNEGRLFFDSADALVPQDTNGREDVYEYEPPGVGGESGCTTARPTYGADAGGCVSLISSGTSAEESAFMDASENGNDVFFQTAARLTPQDLDTSFDVYDAHVCSAAAPCVSAPVSPPPCTSGDSCKAAPSPQPAIFGAPASATFSGAGNVAPSEPVKSATTPKKSAKKKASHVKRKPKKGKSKRRRKGRGSRVHKSLSARTRR